MKNYCLAAFAILTGFNSWSQRVDLDRYTFTASFRDLPKIQIDSSYHTYAFSLEMGPLMKLAVEKDHPEEAIYLEGWRKLPAGAHLKVHLKMEDLIILRTDVNQREEIRKDRNGNVIGKNILFRPAITYSYAASVSVTDYAGRQYQHYQPVSRGEQFKYYGIESGNRFTAANVLLNMFALTAIVSKDVLNRTIQRLSEDLSYNFGYGERSNTEDVWILDSRKHPEYDDFRANWSIIKNALFRMNPNEPTDQIRAEVKPAIAYFESLRKNYTSHSKSDRKLRYASHYLLAKLYYYLDDPVNGVREATDLILNDYDVQDGKGLEAGALRLKDQLELNKRKSRHFPLDINTLQGPAPVSLSSAN